MDWMPEEEMMLKVRNSLRDSDLACTSLQRLSSGIINFVYRGTLVTTLPDGIKTVVIKHGEAYTAPHLIGPHHTAPQHKTAGMKLPTTRCVYEQTMLTALASLPSTRHTNITIETPNILHLFPTINTQIYSDFPSSLELKSYAFEHGNSLSRQQCARLGQALGLWLRRFHSWYAGSRFPVTYERLVTTVERFPKILGGSKETFETIRNVRKGEIGGEDAVLIHRDFWTGNIILPAEPIPDAGTPLTVLVVDWELSQIFYRLFDPGQLFAELYELKHFKDIDAGCWLIEGFMIGYGQIDEKMAFETIIHAGTHLICWGTRIHDGVAWGTQEQVEGVLEIGRGWVVKAWEGERTLFEDGPLGCLFH